MPTDQALTSRLLDRAVARISGAPRTGQQLMAATIDEAIADGRHALIQAGTGTGKSLAYLAAAFAFADAHPEDQVVIATATLALQAQLAGKDIPIIRAAARDLGLAPVGWCVLKGGVNYPCLLKCRDAPADPAGLQYTLDDLEDLDEDETIDASSPLGKQVVALREWAEAEAAAHRIADRDDAPAHSGAAWSAISIPSTECVGQECPHAEECFVRAARSRAAGSRLVVTNHAMVAVEAAGDWPLLRPALLVLDEAHELEARVTSSFTDELSPQMVDRAVRMAAPLVGDDLADDLRGVAARFADALDLADPGRVGAGVTEAVDDLRRALRETATALGTGSSDARRQQVAGVVRETFGIAARVTGADDADVIWLSARPRYGPQLVVAPLRVAATIRETILAHQTTVMTSATLKLGDSFAPLAATVGLTGLEDDDVDYTAVDVGSPFDYRSQGICYVAAHLPPPGRDGTAEEALEEIRALVEAADGHTLGLFSSMRAAERAAAFVRENTDLEVLLQGEAHLPSLIARFLADPEVSLFGTISLWQGVDAPGDTCNLVIVDRIPFPRPDEPLFQARSGDVTRRGGNGFMRVAAAHAGLMLAQGTGRLIRTVTDRGVVAILDSRLLKARYGPFLVSSMPPLWMTTDRTTVLDALRRLNPRP